MNLISGKHLVPLTKKASKRNREFVKHYKKYQAKNEHRRKNKMSLPPLNAFIAQQSECIDPEKEDEGAWNQYVKFTKPKYRSMSNNITRPFNHIDQKVPDPTLAVFDASTLNVNLHFLRCNAITADIGCL